MPLDVAKLLEETGALLSGHFRLSSGLHSPGYVQCALLLEQPRNAREIGEALAAKLRAMNAAKIVAPALGGVIIGYAVAEAMGLPSIFTERKDGVMTLRRGFRIAPDEKVVIVEDVVTTGKSTRETAAVVERLGGRVAGFASILNRSGIENPFDAPYESLLSLNLDTYDEANCSLCARGIALDAPGSRFSNRAG
ncbi:MAG: orotate phosphoribosyltransferase [Thermoanaerobaculia bacterium]|jgi:orotate phosphoribosyltransferase|nr:orotate phosphoribosyltransferase [Thermoanaerobaculia bacterium]